MSKFKDLWKNNKQENTEKSKTFKSIWKGINDMVQEEKEGAEKYHDIAETFESMAEQEEGHKKKLEEIEAKKTQVEKPGPSIHSEKWDKCVADVKAKGTGDPYAICTSQLGEESFKSNMTKSELSLAKEELTKAIDIVEAGDVPHSLLAEQDLKGDHETTAKTITVDYESSSGKKLYRIFESKAAYEQFMSTVGDQITVNHITGLNTTKGQVEQTGKQLDEEIKQADNSSDFVENIKAIQLKRQKAILEERGGETFKSIWGGLKKSAYAVMINGKKIRVDSAKNGKDAMDQAVDAWNSQTKEPIKSSHVMGEI